MYKFLLVFIALLGGSRAEALDSEQQRGQAMLQRMCSRCHAVGPSGASPNKLAPPFRTFSENKLYDPDFVQRLQDGYTTVHRFMPTFRFSEDEARAVVYYLRALQTGKPAGAR
jgi:mono/diheme cytochrome c family protein